MYDYGHDHGMKSAGQSQMKCGLGVHPASLSAVRRPRQCWNCPVSADLWAGCPAARRKKTPLLAGFSVSQTPQIARCNPPWRVRVNSNVAGRNPWTCARLQSACLRVSSRFCRSRSDGDYPLVPAYPCSRRSSGFLGLFRPPAGVSLLRHLPPSDWPGFCVPEPTRTLNPKGFSSLGVTQSAPRGGAYALSLGKYNGVFLQHNRNGPDHIALRKGGGSWKATTDWPRPGPHHMLSTQRPTYRRVHDVPFPNPAWLQWHASPPAP